MLTSDQRLRAYLRRIDLPALPPADRAGLGRLLSAHRQAIPFENLDIPLGRGVSLDPDRVFDKLVTRQRGGYCFEQNSLFAGALAAAGLASRPLLARVRLRAPEGTTPPRTHTLRLVELDGESWLADAGFGGSLVPPLPLADGAAAPTPDGASHRLRQVEGGDAVLGAWVLERAGAAASPGGQPDWQPQYTFDLARVAPDDLEQCNHWTSTRPGTRFTTQHIVSRVLPDGFAAMTDRQLTVHRAGGAESRTIEGVDDYAATLRALFGLALPASELAGLPLFSA